MKLYYSKGSCSLASHIVLEEAGAKFTTQRIDLRAGDQRQPEYLKVNPKAKVPALELEGGEVLTENPAIMSYIADTHPQARLLAAPGELARARAQEWLAWCASTVHVQFSPLFRNRDDEAMRAATQANLERFAAWLRGPFVLGEQFSIADAYTLLFYLWGKSFGFNIGDQHRASAKALLARPGVQRAVTTQELKFDL
jgi:glutathione S-transferase